MTNAEKFEEVFGFEPDENCCIRRECVVPYDLEEKYPVEKDCKGCVFDFWNAEYKGDKE